MLFRKLGDRAGEASMLQAGADARLMLAGESATNRFRGGDDPAAEADGAKEAMRTMMTEALELARQALTIFTDLSDRAGQGNALHAAANANTALGQAADALKDATEARKIAIALETKRGEANACLLQAGAHLVDGLYDKARKAALEAKKLFEEDADPNGKATATDFINNLQVYKSGELRRTDFPGFIRRVEARYPEECCFMVGYGLPRDDDSSTWEQRIKPRMKTPDMSLVEVYHDSSKPVILCDGFESRRAARKMPAEAWRRNGSRQGYPDTGRGELLRGEVLYTVRMQRADEELGSQGAQPPTTGSRPSDRFRRER